MLVLRKCDVSLILSLVLAMNYAAIFHWLPAGYDGAPHAWYLGSLLFWGVAIISRMHLFVRSSVMHSFFATDVVTKICLITDTLECYGHKESFSLSFENVPATEL